ncbi:MAG: hypothetical protein ABR585_10470 [Gemmatimonadaceae bacterium]
MRKLVVVTVAIAAITACRADSPSSIKSSPSQLALDVTVPTPTEADAVAISQNIQANHWPYHTLLNPRYLSGDPASPDFMILAPSGYTQAADNAIWTGHYLAAESFRYSVTHSDEALANIRKAVNGITALIDVTGTDLLARFLVPRSSPYANGILAEEAVKHGVHEATYNGQAYAWLGNTSRDQYSGVFFGLGVAYSLVSDAAVQAEIRSDVTRSLNFLIKNGWNIKMPDGTTSTTFAGRPEQELSFLQVGRLVDPIKWDASYKKMRTSSASSTGNAIGFECLDPYGSYYKFNLDHINFYNLIRLEESGTPRTQYLSAFTKLRNCTRSHQNAHFNMIERGLQGINATRDAQTVDMLGRWLLRPRRNVLVDNNGKYPACATNRACSPIPVQDRYTTDFLWQRSPFQLKGGEDGAVPTPGVDYILPYWMARYYNVLAQ